MTDMKIHRALISLSDKAGVEDFARALKEQGVEILSTGGTAKALQKAGIAVKDVSAHTGFPEMMDGRVKTLHPKIHGGMLARRDEESHIAAMKDHDIGGIDLLAVNLYPFRETVARGAGFEECVENIDIGGPAMVRSAAKNHDFVTVITDPADYARVLAEMAANDGSTTLPLRRELAAKAFAVTAAYDAAIGEWFSSVVSRESPVASKTSFQLTTHDSRLATYTFKHPLRYGENPHQGAALYSDGSNRPGAATATQLQGKELSYNNLNDTDAAFELAAEFDAPAVAIIKHANPCGAATAKTPLDAYRLALRCDPVSAFGGIIALNRPLDAETAAEIIKVFSEVIIAPIVLPEARDVLAKKTNLRVLETGAMPDPLAKRQWVKTIAGGLLVQDADTGRIGQGELKVVTKRAPTAEELDDLLFAFRVAKHVKSNAIVYAGGGATLGIGAGQMSRIDSTRIAAEKMAVVSRESLVASQDIHQLTTHGSRLTTVCASDAFFPFPDGLIAAAEAGATAIIQPGGSIKDADVIAAADERGLAMVFTGMRHFRH